MASSVKVWLSTWLKYQSILRTRLSGSLVPRPPFYECLRTRLTRFWCLLLFVSLQAQFPLEHMRLLWRVMEGKVVENWSAVLCDLTFRWFFYLLQFLPPLPTFHRWNLSMRSRLNWVICPSGTTLKECVFTSLSCCWLENHTHTHAHTFTGVWQWCWDPSQCYDCHTGWRWTGQGTEAVPCRHVQQEGRREREEKTVSTVRSCGIQPVWLCWYSSPSLQYSQAAQVDSWEAEAEWWVASCEPCSQAFNIFLM